MENLFKKPLPKRTYGVEMVTSDDHQGLKEAMQAVFAGVSWNRCHFHLQQNAMVYIPKVSMRKDVAEDIRQIFNAKDANKAQQMLDETVRKYEITAPKDKATSFL